MFSIRQSYYAENLVLPPRCVVCDSEHAELTSYVQEHFPIPIPGFGGFHRQTQVALPYCRYHADAFRFRFRALRIIQYFFIACIFLCGIAGFALLDKKPAPHPLGIPLVTVSMICLFILLPASLVVRGFMYDAFFICRPNGIHVKSKHPHFLKQIQNAGDSLPANSEEDELGAGV